MSTLFVIGDSFSYHHRGGGDLSDHQKLLWPKQVANHIGCKYMINLSLSGVSQDYCWNVLEKYLNDITPDDYLIVVLTDYTRYWFLKDDPEASNFVNIENHKHKWKWQTAQSLSTLKDFIKDNQISNAVKEYIVNIQRDEIDIAHQQYRLGWLHDQVSRKNLRKPLILQAFDCKVVSKDWPRFEVAVGNLTTDVSLKEFEEGVKEWFFDKISDYRFNHLCLSNHTVLAKKVLDFFLNGKTVDLTNDFKECIIKGREWQSKEFFTNELDDRLYSLRFKN
jgi:hypothetical protein